MTQRDRPIIRRAHPEDISTILALLRLKADFDGCPEALEATADRLQRDLFGDRPLAYVLLAEIGATVGGFATYHINYSTFLAHPGIWLDDLYLQPDYRHYGIGKLLMRHLCQMVQSIDGARIDWTVAVDNLNAIGFYQHLGGTLIEPVRLCRLSRETISYLAHSVDLDC